MMNEVHDMADDVRHDVERLFELAVLLTDGLADQLRGHGLSRARAEVLWELAHRGPQTQRELAGVLRCSPRNITALLDGLQVAGHVHRRPHPTDRRARVATLTEAGRDLAARMRRSHDEFWRDCFKDVPAADAATFHRVVRHIHDRIQHPT
jgi:DNA-binding MarR family transcriptional regulator